MESFFTNMEFSNLGWQIVTPLIFSLIDVITGYIQAVINKNVDSKKMRQGLLHKIILILIIILSFTIHVAFNMPSVSITVCLYICLMEFVSIMENVNKAGIDLKINDFLKGGKNDEIK